MVLPREIASAGSAWRDAYVMRSLLAAHPELVDTLMSVRESLFTVKGMANRYTGLYGESVIALKAWDVATLGRLLAEGDDLPGGVRFLGFAEGFEPGVFQRMLLRLELPSARFQEAGQQLRRFLHHQHVPVNVRNPGGSETGRPEMDGFYVLDIPEKARKKRVIFAGRYVEAHDVFRAELEVSPKFDLMAYVRSFPVSFRYREAVAEVCDLHL
jgi:hypothetical protein